MRKVIITICFNRPDKIRSAIQRLEATQNTNGFEKYLIDVAYPLPDKKTNAVDLALIANRNNWTLLKPLKNRGVAGNWTWAVNELSLTHGDCIIGMDPDSEPVDDGWCDAVVDVIRFGNIAYCGLTRISPPGLETEVDESKYMYSRSYINTRKVRHYGEPIGWPMGGFNAGFIKEGRLTQPRSHYGFIEIDSINNMRGTDWKWVMLDEFRDQTSERGEPTYRDWKIEQAQGKTDLDFEAWLFKKGILK